MKTNFADFKNWMLIHMIIMNTFLIIIIQKKLFQIVMLIIIMYFYLCIIENLNHSSILNSATSNTGKTLSSRKVKR